MTRILALCVSLVALAVTIATGGTTDTGAWYAGDFHVHTTYSHDSWDPIADDETSEPYTLGHSVGNQFAIAGARGLDFIAITDHNDIRAQSDPGFGASGVLGIHAYEASYGGHAQLLGATSCYSPEGTFAGPQDCSGWRDKSPARLNQVAGLLRAAPDDGTFQINHPAAGSIDWPNDPDWDYGYDVVPDSVEVWNIQSFWQPPAFSSNSIDDAIRLWEGFLDRGYKVAATGGSDNHWVSTTAVQGVGQPTTWVHAPELSEDAILEGIRRGRTTISWQPPEAAGPRMFLAADADIPPDGYAEAMVGDTVPATSGLEIQLDNAPPGSEVWLYYSEGIAPTRIPVVSSPINAIVPNGARWVRAELLLPDHTQTPVGPACDEQIGASSTYCRNRFARLAMTSAIYIA